MSKQNEYADLYQEEHEKMDQINDLMDEFYTISAEYSLVPEIDPGIGEWSPEKETGLVDAIRIEEEVQGLEGEIVVAQRLINEHGLSYATVANILGTHEPQLRRWLGK